MKQIGAEIGVNESRVSQLHARAIRRLREALGEMGPQQIAEMRKALVAFAAGSRRWRRQRCRGHGKTAGAPHGRGAAVQARDAGSGCAPDAAIAPRDDGRAQPPVARGRLAVWPIASLRAYDNPSRTACNRSPSRNGFGEPAAAALFQKRLGVGAGDVAGHEDHALRECRRRACTSVR